VAAVVVAAVVMAAAVMAAVVVAAVMVGTGAMILAAAGDSASLGKCTRQNVQNVDLTVKFHSSQLKIGQSTAENVLQSIGLSGFRWFLFMYVKTARAQK